MIKIINRGLVDKEQGDLHTYDIIISNELICQFHHKRSEGLSECLKRASEAVACEQVRRDNKFDGVDFVAEIEINAEKFGLVHIGNGVYAPKHD